MQRKIAVPAIALIVLVAAGGGLAFTRGLTSRKAAAPAVVPTVPIVAGVVARHDVPIYLTGVGTVIAYNTNIVRSADPGSDRRHQLRRRAGCSQR